MNGKIPLIWSNDDITVGKRDNLQRQLDFLAEMGIKGTLFVVPCPRQKNGVVELTSDPAVVELLKAARRDGHDMHQHSTTHACEENGTPDLRMFDLMGDGAKVHNSMKRFMLERLWQVDALEAQIGWGHRVWQEAFGQRSEGFRPGCGAFCGNMYKALENLGFSWCSARLVSMTAWMWAANHNDYPFQWDGPARPLRQGRLVEFPILDDMAFRIGRDRMDRFVELGWRHWQECVKRGAPYVLVSHYFGLEHDEGAGYEIHRRMLARILASGQAAPMTLSQYYRELQAGQWPWAEPAEVYPTGEVLPEWHALSRR